MKNHKLQTYDKGLKAERWASIWLRLKGYKILQTRYKTPVGEVDLIAKKRNVLVFVEVKARQTHDKALESITPHMRARIARAASYYMARHSKYAGCDMRFDLVTVCPAVLGMVTIEHLDNAWSVTA